MFIPPSIIFIGLGALALGVAAKPKRSSKSTPVVIDPKEEPLPDEEDEEGKLPPFSAKCFTSIASAPGDFAVGFFYEPIAKAIATGRGEIILITCDEDGRLEDAFNTACHQWGDAYQFSVFSPASLDGVPEGPEKQEIIDIFEDDICTPSQGGGAVLIVRPVEGGAMLFEGENTPSLFYVLDGQADPTAFVDHAVAILAGIVDPGTGESVVTS